MTTQITYNGIVLDFLETRSYIRDAIMDGPTYLYTRHVLEIVAIYNPKRNSFNNNAAVQEGNLGPEIDTFIRHKLMVPRKQLIYTIGNKDVLETPKKLLSTDANNGPIPLHCNVEKVHGRKTLRVTWTIQADINECAGSTPPIVLSHRWTMEHDIDEHFFTTRIIHGHAILRTDYMLSTGTYPDHFRSYFIHPIPDNFQRTKVNVIANEDGNTLEYTVIDTEKPFVLDQDLRVRGVTKIEAYHNLEVGSPSFDVAIGGMAQNIAQGGGAGGVAAGPWGAALGAAFGFLRGAAEASAKITHTFIVRVWGHQQSVRQTLEVVGWAVLGHRFEAAGLGAGLLGINLNDTWFNVAHDLMGKWIEIQVRIKRSPTANLLDNFGNRGVMPIQETLPNVTMQGGAGMGLGQASNTVRGTFVGKLVAQQLQEACSNIPTLANASTPMSAVPRL